MSEASAAPEQFSASNGYVPFVQATPSVRNGNGAGGGVGGLLDTIQLGDNVTVLATLPDECIDLVVTSPPYDDLRKYGGHSWDFEAVARELTRVLKQGGVIVWVVADATVNGSETLTSMRQAIHFKDVCGLNVHDTMIYKKAGGSPNIHHPRYTHCWEFMFVLTKGTPKAFNAARRRRNTTAGAVVQPKRKMQRNGEIKSFDVATTVTQEYSTDVNVWEYLVGKASGDEGMGEHSAYFPESLAKDHVASWSNPGDLVLDPFAGSGTTLKAAKELNRHWLGIEINPEYLPIINGRLSQDVLALFSEG